MPSHMPSSHVCLPIMQLESVVSELQHQLLVTEATLRRREEEVTMLRQLLTDSNISHRHIQCEAEVEAD